MTTTKPKPYKISIIGISGSGKSTYARQLSKDMNLPLYHMDSFYWRSGWQEVSEETWLKQEAEIIAKDKWIIEGYICAKSIERLHQADQIIYLDKSGIACCWNGIKRWWQHRKTPRPELQGSPEKLDFKMLKTMLFRAEREEIEEVLLLSGKDYKTIYNFSTNSGEILNIKPT